MGDRQASAKSGKPGDGATPAWFDPGEVYISPLSAEEEQTARTEQPQPPTWPVAVGLISLLLGVVSAGLNVAIAAAPALLRRLERMGDFELPAEAALPPLEMTASAQANALAKIAAAVVLALAGALTLARNRAGAWMHLVYGGFGVAIGAWGVWEGIQEHARLAEWASENPDAIAARFITEPSVVSTVMSAAWGLAWPVFALVWFGAIRRHRTQLGRTR